MAKQITENTTTFSRVADKLTQMPGFMRPYVAQLIGVSVEKLNRWIASPDEETQELVFNAAVSLAARAKLEQRRRLGGAS